MLPCSPSAPSSPSLPSPLLLQLEGLLQQVDLLELSSRAAQQEKEQLQVCEGCHC